MNIPKGWKLVPFVPTPEMHASRYAIPMEEKSPQAEWEALLNAAPTPPITAIPPCVEPYKSHQCLDCGTVIELTPDAESELVEHALIESIGLLYSLPISAGQAEVSFNIGLVIGKLRAALDKVRP